MKKSSLVLLASLALFISCGSSDDKEKKEDFFPVDAFLKSQIAQVDTTLNTIRQFLYIDSSRTDTIYIRREISEQWQKILSDCRISALPNTATDIPKQSSLTNPLTVCCWCIRPYNRNKN